MTEIKELQIPGYEKVIEATNKEAGLHAFIAIHNTTLGPSLGGTRIYPYPSREEALNDCLKLAKAMTYKSALAQDGLGGGKSVIIADPKTEKTPDLLHAFAEVVETLKGLYVAAEDVGSTADDMMVVREKTRYVAALPTDESSGDPSRFTAWGIFRGIQSVCRTLWGDRRALRRRIAIQGLGSVGAKLASLLFWRGAELILCDIDEEKIHHLKVRYGAEVVSPEEFIATKCDILAPCALGGVINDDAVEKLQCKAIAGAANNQLDKPEHGMKLQKRGILYAPDFVINSGGIINAASEFDDGPYDPKRARDKVDQIYENLLEIFAKAQMEGRPTSEIADEIAEYNLTHRIGKREQAIW